MKPKSSLKKSAPKAPAERVVKDIRRATRRHFSAEDKIRIVLEGLRGEDSIAELCRKEGIAQSLYYTWSKEFMEAGKRRLAGDTARAATTGEVHDLRVRVCQNRGPIDLRVQLNPTRIRYHSESLLGRIGLGIADWIADVEFENGDVPTAGLGQCEG